METLKKCAKCRVNLPETEEYFSLRRNKKSITFHSYCRKCKKVYHKKYMKEYRKTDKCQKREKEHSRNYSGTERHRDAARRHSKTDKRRQYLRKWERENRKNPHVKLRRSISSAVSTSLRRFNESKNGLSILDILPYTLGELCQHLESQFDENMSWENYGSYWHLDHIVPQAYFSYESIDDPKLLECWALQNLRPLEKIENLRKNSIYEGKRYFLESKG